MNKKMYLSFLSLSIALLLSFSFICACASSNFAKNKIDKSAALKQDDLTPQERAQLAFYVYSDFKAILNHYYPSGWMGDSRDLSFNQQYARDIYAGKHCIRVQYTPRGSQRWAGIYWQQPSNNWGDKQGGFDLSKATYVTFWLKGEKGGEVVSEVKIGGLKGAFPDSAEAATKKKIVLTNEWKLYWIDLRKKDTSYIAGGFSFVVTRSDNPNGCTFYMDEIRYEMNK
ncbi:MAG: hypothetical protein LBD46_05490 [Endomicrobium sp.]|jgi:hypothetical protein|nr:hypothetical protein [Endomicrobium sp.]